jgi:ferredoxin/flavodoxin
MKITIIYFSSSGNIKYVAELIKQGLIFVNKEVDLVSWNELKSNRIQISNSDTIGIGAPIYALSYPPPIIKLIKTLPKTREGSSFFLFDTCSGLPGNAIEKAKEILEKKGYLFMGALEIIAPTFDSVFESSYYNHVRWSRKKIDRAFQFGIQMGNFLGKQIPPLDWKIKRMPFANLIRVGFKHLEEFYYRFIGNSIKAKVSKCTSCKICEKFCPTNAIEVKNLPKINPDLCIGCFKCIRKCPQGTLYLKQFPDAKYFKGPQEINGYISPTTILREYQKAM